MLLSQVLGECVGIWEIILLEDSIRLLLFIGWIDGIDLLDSLFPVWPVVDLLKEDLVVLSVRVTVSSGNVLEGNEILALLGELEDSHRTVIVYLDSITEWLVEIDTCSTVDDDFKVVNESLLDLRVESESLETEVTVDWDDLLL